jgi:hypothetical protein
VPSLANQIDDSPALLATLQALQRQLSKLAALAVALQQLHTRASMLMVTGVSELYVAVSADRDPHPVRSFPTFTRDLHALADWLLQCGIRSVAMESTSVYWIPVYQILEARGLEVYGREGNYYDRRRSRKWSASRSESMDGSQRSAMRILSGWTDYAGDSPVETQA